MKPSIPVAGRARWPLILAILLAVAALAAGGWFLARQKAGAGGSATAASAPGAAASAPPALRFRADEVTTPRRAELPETIAFSGPLVAARSAVVKAKAIGVLTDLAVGEGDRVQRGQVLGRLELPELGHRVAERQAQIALAEANLAQAERVLGDNQRLAEQGFISPAALQGNRAQVATARAQVNAARATLDTVRVAGRDAQLVAPLAGIVSKRHVVAGEKLAPEQAVLTVVDPQSLELLAQVSTAQIGKLRVGQPVTLQIEGIDQPVAGKLARIAPVAEAGTRSIPVAVTVANPGERLRGGQYAVARVEVPDTAERLLLPLSAIADAGGQPSVWTIEQGRLMRRSVTLGRRDALSARVEVLGGVQPGATVLAARFDNLSDGQQASVLPPAAGAPAAPAASAPAAPASR